MAGGKLEMTCFDRFINKVICGDCLEMIKEMPANSIDMCLTSPPYWGLRDYGVEQIFGGNRNCKHRWGRKIIRRTYGNVGQNPGTGNQKRDVMKGHENKGQFCQFCGAWKGQLGLEPTSELYIEHMTVIFHGVKRILKKKGTLWLNIGDTYFGSGCGTNDYRTPASLSLSKPELYKSPRPQNIRRHKYLKSKCLCMIPERLVWSLIQDGWILRNKIIWHKPNPMPSSVKDRFSNTWEYVYLFAKSQRYYFDLDAVREEHIIVENRPMGIVRNRELNYHSKENLLRGRKWSEVPGQQTQTIEKHSGYYNKNGKCLVDFEKGKNPGDHWSINTEPFPEAHFAVFPKKLCEKPIKAGCTEGGIVLDPFCGSGTALFVAKEMKRRYIGIDIKKEYCEMAEKRLTQGVL